jgi:FdhE protein
VITSFDELVRERPEWASWIAVVAAAVADIDDPAWDAVDPCRASAADDDAPLLALRTLNVDRAAVQRHVDRVMRHAAVDAAGETPWVSPLFDPLDVLEAAINRHGERLTQYAQSAGVDAERFRAVASLLAQPLLHACRRRCASDVAESWARGYCPVCGGWPAFAEVRGVERSRYLRCGDCGGEWESRCLECAFCGTSDHEQLISLVPEREFNGKTIDACNACRGYVKVFTTLRGSLPAEVLLNDLATAELDIAAAMQGYRRIGEPGYALDAKVVEHDATERRR